MTATASRGLGRGLTHNPHPGDGGAQRGPAVMALLASDDYA
jgi:hypothetical protein